MALHLVKLCVGVETIGELEAWIAERRRLRAGGGKAPADHQHVTRQTPKRHPELVAGGSLYWVIKGQIACRQRVLAVRPVTGHDGIPRCGLALEPALALVHPRPCRPFQGWRYLTEEDAPRDLGTGSDGLEAMPEELRRELAELGLL